MVFLCTTTGDLSVCQALQFHASNVELGCSVPSRSVKLCAWAMLFNTKFACSTMLEDRWFRALGLHRSVELASCNF